MPLDQLPRGSAAVDHRGAERLRLTDLGLRPGTEVRADLTSPPGDPLAYLICGSLIVLRRSQARSVHVDLVSA